MRIEYERVGYEVHVGEQPVDARVLEGCLLPSDIVT